MYDEVIGKLTEVAKKKVNLLNSSTFKYLVSSAFAGAFIGIGILLIFTIGGYMGGEPSVKVVMGLSFSVALSLVIFSGTDLFTGNNLVMTVGVLNKGVKTSDLIRVWIVSYIGNLLGAILLSFLFVNSGLVDKGPVMEFFQKMALAKANPDAISLIFRGILCNIMVCLAVFLSFKVQDETTKIILIIMCLFVFITVGFEHSIANMTVYAVGLFSSSMTEVTLGQAIYNLATVTLGNIIGGAFFIGCGVFSLRSKS